MISIVKSKNVVVKVTIGNINRGGNDQCNCEELPEVIDLGEFGDAPADGYAYGNGNEDFYNGIGIELL